MILAVLNPRNIESKDWAIVLFLVAFFLVALIKTVFEKRFNDFFKIAISNKYLKTYRDSSQLMTGFNSILFLINLFSMSFFILIVASQFGYCLKNDWIFFIQIFTFLFVFILVKFLIEKIIATLFGTEEVVELVNLQKISYRSYIGLLLLPVSMILFYTNFLSNNAIYILISLLLTLNVISYGIFLKNHQKIIISKLFYFILYLCALEIAPYYFLFYLIKKNSAL